MEKRSATAGELRDNVRQNQLFWAHSEDRQYHRMYKTGKIVRKGLGATFDFLRSSKFLYSSVFLLGIVLRGIPELLVPQYPVGYETITHYAPPMFAFREQGLADVFVEFFRFGPLFYTLMWFAHVMSRAHPYLILKVVGPLLYGGLTVSFLLFLKRGLRLDGKMAFVATLLLVFQVAALRESWDRFRNVLGLIFVFAALTALRSDHRFRWPLVAGLAVFTALSREYIALVLFVAVLGFAFLERKDRMMSLIALAPALVVFAVINFPRQLWWSYILDGQCGQYASGSYWWVVQDAFSIFAVCFLPLLPLVVKGFRRDGLLDPMIGLLLLGSFSVIVSPWFAVPGYQRWMVLLVFPFSVYAVRGFERFRLFDKRGFRKLVVILLIFMVIGVGYSSGAFSYVVLPNSWVPNNLVQSSIGWNQIDDVRGILRWLNEKAASNSSILVEERFYGWTLIYLKRANDDVKVIAYTANSLPQHALEKALSDGFRWIYLIWYTDSSWKNFEILYSQNNVSIFLYQSEAAARAL